MTDQIPHGSDVLGWVRPGTRRMGLFGALWHSRKLVRWMVRLAWAHVQVVVNPVLSVRDLLTIALRTAWNCGSRDHWILYHLAGQARYGVRFPERVYSGPTAPCWDERTATVLTAIDEIHDDLAISPRTWEALHVWFDSDKRLTFLCTTALFEMVSVVLPSLGLPTHWVPDFGRRSAHARTCGPRRRRRPGHAADRFRPQDTVAEAPKADPGLWSPVNPGITIAALSSQPWILRVLLSAVDAQKRPTLPHYDAHILLLRTIRQAGPAREWATRLGIALKSGVDEAVLARICSDTDDGSTEHAAVLIRAVDELDREYFITDETWALLRRRLSKQQMIELLFLVGYHRMIATAVNTLE